VLAADERTKSVMALTELGDGLALALLGPASALITAPVFLVIGENDALFCGALGSDCSSAETFLAGERPYYPLSPDVRAHVRPGSGHNIALHRDAAQVQDVIADWLPR